MGPEEYIERNIKNFLSASVRPDAPTPSAMQRVCRIGFNQAMRTLFEMERRGIIKRNKTDPWRFEWVISD